MAAGRSAGPAEMSRFALGIRVEEQDHDTVHKVAVAPESTRRADTRNLPATRPISPMWSAMPSARTAAIGSSRRWTSVRSVAHSEAAGVGQTLGVRSVHRGRRSMLFRSAFAGFRFPPDVIVLAARWYLQFGLSYWDVEELLAERGVEVDHRRNRHFARRHRLRRTGPSRLTSTTTPRAAGSANATAPSGVP